MIQTIAETQRGERTHEHISNTSISSPSSPQLFFSPVCQSCRAFVWLVLPRWVGFLLVLFIQWVSWYSGICLDKQISTNLRRIPETRLSSGIKGLVWPVEILVLSVASWFYCPVHSFFHKDKTNVYVCVFVLIGSCVPAGVWWPEVCSALPQ